MDLYFFVPFLFLAPEIENESLVDLTIFPLVTLIVSYCKAGRNGGFQFYQSTEIERHSLAK